MPHIKSLMHDVVRASRTVLVISLLIMTPSFLLPNRVQAAAGNLDSSFGSGGKVTTHFSSDFEEAFDLAIQPDGRIIAIGQTDLFPASDFAIARYNPDGSLDPTFGSGGKVTTDFFGGHDLAVAVALQSDGRIVVAGGVASSPDASFSLLDFGLARYLTDGSLDTSFGVGGKVATDFSGDFDVATDVVLQPDGKIVAAGTKSIGLDYAVARYNTDGSLDTDFGSGGTVTTDFFGNGDQATAVALQSDGKIVVGGQAVSVVTFNDFGLVRYNGNGSLDTSFGSGGKVTTDFFIFDIINDLFIQPDGKIVAGGTTLSGNVDFALARYNSDGTLDPAFGSGGKVVTDLFSQSGDSPNALALQPDGKIVAAGSTIVGPALDFALVRYNSDGNLDTSFGSGGKVQTDFFDNLDVANAVALQTDGKIIAGGRATIPGQTLNSDFALARYNGAFDLCLQDDGNGNLLEINTTTGEYQFTSCSGFVIGGTGVLTRRGCTITLQHFVADRRVLATINTCQKKATASIRLLSQGRTFTITDRNTANNTCACGERRNRRGK